MAFPTKCYEITIDFDTKPLVRAMMDFHDMAICCGVRAEAAREPCRRELAQPSFIVAPGTAR